MKKQMWEFKQATVPDTLELYIYGDIEGDGYDWWTEQVISSETSANHFKEELNKYPDVKQINVYVNSQGGYVMEAMAIRSQLKRHPAYVTGYDDGFACSAASFILTGCDKVIMYSNTMQMIHNMWNVAVGNAKELRKAADDLDAIMQGNRQAYLEKSGGKLTEEKLIELLDAESWLTAQECLEYGLADEIVEKEVDLATAKQLLQKANLSMAQHIEFSKSLAAQLKELVNQTKEPAAPAEPEPTPDPAPAPQENKPIKFLQALMC